MNYLPSPQQAAFYDWVREGSGSCVLEAVAGAGKTTTLVHSLALMTGDIFFGAYNKKIADEIKARAPAHVDCSTMHAAGWRFYRRAYKAVKLDGNKCRDLFRGNVVEADGRFESVVLKLVSLAKQSGMCFLRDESREAWLELIEHYDLETFNECTSTDESDYIIQLASGLFHDSLAHAHEIADFDDMIFVPLIRNVRVWEHDWVLLDEAQDTDATRRALALRMLKRGGRLVAVGDRHQAIYGFTGADSDALDLIAEAVNAKQMPLTITYRCPKTVVAEAQKYVSHIQAAETAPEGSVARALSADLATLAKPGDAILCRFNAPLIKYVYKFIAAGIPAKVEGREIGAGLKQLATKWKSIRNLPALLDKLGEYQERETAKHRAQENEAKARAIDDKVECLRVIIGRVQAAGKSTVADVVAEIDTIFGEDNGADVITLCSIHKSKGREWHKVVWLQTGPSKWARKAWEQGQEVNLCYVATTRAKSELVLIDITGEL